MIPLLNHGAKIILPKYFNLGMERGQDNLVAHNTSVGLRAKIYMSWWCRYLPNTSYWGWSFHKWWSTCITAIFGHCQDAYMWHTDILVILKESQEHGTAFIYLFLNEEICYNTRVDCKLFLTVRPSVFLVFMFSLLVLCFHCLLFFFFLMY